MANKSLGWGLVDHVINNNQPSIINDSNDEKLLDNDEMNQEDSGLNVQDVSIEMAVLNKDIFNELCKNLDQLLQNTTINIQELDRMLKQYFSFGVDTKKINKEFIIKRKKVAQCITECKSLLSKFDLNDPVQRGTYLTFLSRIEETKQQMFKLMKVFTDNNTKESKIGNVFDLPDDIESGSQQLMVNKTDLDEIELDEMMMLERGKAINKINSDLKNLYEMFNDIHLMVQDQGNLLDSISLNVQRANIQVNKGNEQLRIAKNSQQCGKCCLYILIAIIAIIILTVGLFVFTK